MKFEILDLTLKSLIAPVLALGVVTGCTNREVPVTQHEGPVVVAGDEVVVSPTSGDVDVTALRKIQPEKMNAQLKVGTSNSQKVAILTELAPFILDRAYIENPRTSASPQMRTALEAFMRALVGDAKSKGLVLEDPTAAQPWLEKTRAVIESGCDGLLRGCTTIGFFRADVGSAKVMSLSARGLDNAIEAEDGKSVESKERRNGLVRTYYRRLKVAFDLKNRSVDNDLEFLYLFRAAQYVTAFESAQPTTRERQLLTQHVEVFETILNGFNPDLSTPEARARFESFVNNFGPWRYSRHVENPFGKAATRMLNLAARNFLYSSKSDGKGNKLAPSLDQAIQDSQVIPKAESEKGQKVLEADLFKSVDSPFSLISKQIREEQASIWSSLGLSDSFARDEYFFLVDRVFGGHLNIDDASEVWYGTVQNQDRLLKTAEKYIKIQVAAQIVRTNQYMAGIYSNKQWSSSTLLEKAVEQSYPVQTQWNQLLSRINFVHLFLDRNLKSTEDVLGTSEFSKLDISLRSLRNNIKFLSVYPNMMLMAFYMAEAKFKIPLYTFFGKIDIDSSLIISLFFNGKLAPFFNFGNDGVGLKRIETLYAFLFALQTDTFRSFSDSTGQALDVPKFFEVVVSKFLDEDRVSMRNALDDLRKEMRQGSMDVFVKTCEQDREFAKNGVKPGTKGAKLPIELWHFKYGTYIGSSSSGSHGAAALKFHSDSRAKAIRSLTSSLRTKLEFVKVMANLFDRHLANSGVDEQKRKETAEKIMSFTRPIERNQAEYLTEIMRWNKRIANCVDHAVKFEIERQDELLRKEEEHLRTVWAAMKAARAAGANNAGILKAINQKVGDSTGRLLVNNDQTKFIQTSLPYVPKSTVTEDNYVYAPLDAILRLVQFAKTTAPNLYIVMPSDLSDSSMWKDNSPKIIPFSNDVNEFVHTAMKNYDESSGSIVNWIGNTNDPDPFIGRILVNIELFKLGKIKTFDVGSEKCLGNQDITKCPMIEEALTAKELVAQTAKIIRTLSMTEGGKLKPDSEVMAMIGLTERWSKNKYKAAEFLLDSKGDPLTLFEGVYDKLIEDEKLLDEAKDFNLTDLSIGTFLFSPENEFRGDISAGFKPSVEHHFRRGFELINAIEEREKADLAANRVLEFAYELTPSGVSTTSIERGQGGAPVYLQRLKANEWPTKRELFDKETGCAFQSDPKAREKANCK